MEVFFFGEFVHVSVPSFHLDLEEGSTSWFT
jgi:hypothetical protein